jgi:hypothetical protein
MKKQSYEPQAVLAAVTEIAAELKQMIEARAAQDSGLPSAFEKNAQVITTVLAARLIPVLKLQEMLAQKGYVYDRDEVSAALNKAGIRSVEKRARSKAAKRQTPDTPGRSAGGAPEASDQNSDS